MVFVDEFPFGIPYFQGNFGGVMVVGIPGNLPFLFLSKANLNPSQLMARFPDLRSVLDLGCGDMSWIQCPLAPLGKLPVAEEGKSQLGGGFKDFLFLPVLGEDSHFD